MRLLRPRPQTLDQHPNASEIAGVLSRLSAIGDRELLALAAAWRNDALLSRARDIALSPDSPLVVEVLASFEAVSSLFEDDLRGDATWIHVDPVTTTTALKAVRDAIAAAYAKPVLRRREHAQLMAPWRSVFPDDAYTEPDLGPHGEAVRGLLSVLPRVAGRCHDVAGAEAYEHVVDAAWGDEGLRRAARESAFLAAVETERRRAWALVRRSAAEHLSRPCVQCGRRADTPELGRVLSVVLDAACALLVADAVSDDTVETLTSPVRSLIPRPRTA